jgi:methyl-accepting chemotaxis protein
MRISDWSLRVKLTVGTGLLFAVVTLFVWLFFPARLDATARLWAESRARGVAAILQSGTAAAVEFDDSVAATDVLAGLASTPEVVYATLKKPDGTTLGAYHPERASAPAAGAAPEAHVVYEGGLLHALAEVKGKGAATASLSVGFSLSELDQQRRDNERTVLVVCALIFCLGVAFSWVLGTLLVRPIGRLTDLTSRIVSAGDLGQKIDITSKDEIGRLAGTFADLVEKLREIPTSLLDSVGRLTTAVGSLSENTHEQGRTIARQATALQETQVTAQEIKQTSLVAAQKASAVLEIAERADAVSRSGEAAIEQTLGTLNDMLSAVHGISEKMTELVERMRQIGSITDTVKSLADQSNILALNAAIEAARSGEHGKGFGVVAREIRSLADQSIQATTRVREILQDVSVAVDAAMTMTANGTTRVEGGLVQVRSSGESLRELSAMVKENSGAVRQITAAVTQQNAGVSQMFTAVSEMSKMMDDTVKRIEATNQAVTQLKDVSKRVEGIVDRFKV